MKRLKGFLDKISLIGNKVTRVASRVFVDDVVALRFVSDAIKSVNLTVTSERREAVLGGLKRHAISDEDN
jgi:hypothetical protein